MLRAEPQVNITPEQAGDFIRRVVEGYELFRPKLEETAYQRSRKLLEAHQRVRQAIRQRGLRTHVDPQLPVGVLGIYVYLLNT